MGDVIVLGGPTRLDLPPDRVLEAATGELETVLVLGYDHEGNEYYAASTADGGTLVWLTERFKTKLVLGDFDDES